MREWHDGELSSYDLLVLLEFLPAESAFRIALRDGEFSEDQITWRHIANELARLRATMHAVHGGQRYDPPLLKSVAELRDDIDLAEEIQDRRENFFSFADRPALALAGGQKQLDPDDVLDDGGDF